MAELNSTATPSANGATLLARVSAKDAERLEAMHRRVLDLSRISGVDATKEVTGFVYEILQMPVVDKVRRYDPDKDYISDLLIELGQATAIVDLVYMLAAGKAVDSIDGANSDTISNSLYTALERLHAVKVAAEAILAEWYPPQLKPEVAHAHN
jgi:hypothetical protein